MMGPLIWREVRRGFSGGAWLPIAFFLLVATLIPFAVGPDAQILSRVGAGAMWVAALLAALLPVERLVQPDLDDGVIDQLAIRGVSDEVIALAKTIGHWLTFGPLLLVATFPAAALLRTDGDALQSILISLAIGTPALAALSVAVAALTAGLPRAGALAGLLMLPVAIPLLIFGVGGEPSALKFEAATALLLLVGSPFVAGAALRAARS
ncbi:heme exporter protein CcmB [Sphingomicrobium flavum]|uniref:heme exporter protein CcmB n=1 Tax=Sphingomicrobium flavum TaxID=1229164 RepID=UPI0035E3CE93